MSTVDGGHAEGPTRARTPDLEEVDLEVQDERSRTRADVEVQDESSSTNPEPDHPGTVSERADLEAQDESSSTSSESDHPDTVSEGEGSLRIGKSPHTVSAPAPGHSALWFLSGGSSSAVDAATQNRGCFWFGTAIALGASTIFEIFVRDIFAGGDSITLCEPDPGRRLGTQSRRLPYDSSPDGYLYMLFGLGALNLFAGCWAVLLHVFEAYNIDYWAILNRSPLVSTSKSDALIAASKLTIIWNISVRVFNRARYCDAGFSVLFPVLDLIPMFALLWTLIYVVYWSRGTIPRLLFYSVFSVFSAAGPSDLDGYVGNWLTSLTKPIVEVVYMTCVAVDRQVGSSHEETLTGEEVTSMCYDLTKASRFNVGFFILILPNFLRFAQNMRKFTKTGKLHPCVTNASKYLLGMLVTTFGTFHMEKVSILLMLIACKVVYSFLWDIFMDWGLFKATNHVLCVPCGKCRMRRRRLLGEGKCIYMAGVIMNFCARIFFIYTLVPFDAFERSTTGYQGALFGIVRMCFFLSPSVEVLRRSMWTVFSFEYKWIGKSPNMPLKRAGSVLSESNNVGAGAVKSSHLKVELAVVLGLGVMLATGIVLTGIHS